MVFYLETMATHAETTCSLLFYSQIPERREDTIIHKSEQEFWWKICLEYGNGDFPALEDSVVQWKEI